MENGFTRSRQATSSKFLPILAIALSTPESATLSVWYFLIPVFWKKIFSTTRHGRIPGFPSHHPSRRTPPPPIQEDSKKSWSSVCRFDGFATVTFGWLDPDISKIRSCGKFSGEVFVTYGSGTISSGERSYNLNPGHWVHLPPETEYALCSKSREALIFVLIEWLL